MSFSGREYCFYSCLYFSFRDGCEDHCFSKMLVCVAPVLNKWESSWCKLFAAVGSWGYCVYLCSDLEVVITSRSRGFHRERSDYDDVLCSVAWTHHFVVMNLDDALVFERIR